MRPCYKPSSNPSSNATPRHSSKPNPNPNPSSCALTSGGVRQRTVQYTPPARRLTQASVDTTQASLDANRPSATERPWRHNRVSRVVILLMANFYKLWFLNMNGSRLHFFTKDTPSLKLLSRIETWPIHIEKSMFHGQFTPIFHRNCVGAMVKSCY
jgi:hypothetical protein